MPHISGFWDRPRESGPTKGQRNPYHTGRPRAQGVPRPLPSPRKPGPLPPEVLPFAILGAGAAGLFAGCLAGETGLPALLLERKSRAGCKLLMTGNGRCNLTKEVPVSRMLADFGGTMESFLAPALNAMPPRSIMAWFERHGVPLKTMGDGRVFPASEKATDIAHALVDTLRDTDTPICLNAEVLGLRKEDGFFSIQAQTFALRAKRVLIATGGVGYPKTGSVGDGQQWAKALGHTLVPYRPGLVGFVAEHPWIHRNAGRTLPRTTVRVRIDGHAVYEGDGQLDCLLWGLGGAAAYNASRYIGRECPRTFTFEWEADGQTFRIETPKTRPLKESIATIGGIPLEEVDPETMSSRICEGLYFAGEVLDIDGPTGGYNLSAAFSTAALAVRSARKSIRLV